MFDPELMRSAAVLSSLNDEMIKKVAGKSKLSSVKAGTYLFREDDPAVHFYVVVEGKVALEISKTSSMVIRLKEIYPSKAFGVSSLIDSCERKCITDAVATEDSKVLVWKAADLEKLFFEDYRLGFLFLRKVAIALEDRLRAKNFQMATGLYSS